jgi:ferric-dicitrate binding protein FerR (iron transport regulator)
MTEERYQVLMVKVVDDMASPAENNELMAWLTEHPELRSELEEHMALKAVTDGWVDRLMLDLAEHRHIASGGFRLERALAVSMLLSGIALLTGFSLSELFFDPDVPALVKAGTGLVVSGGFLGLFSAIRWRWVTRSQDRYTEIER